MWPPHRHSEFREQVRNLRRKHNDLSGDLPPEARHVLDEVVIALELLTALVNGMNGRNSGFWANILKLPGAGPAIWLLLGFAAAALLTGQVSLPELFGLLR